MTTNNDQEKDWQSLQSQMTNLLTTQKSQQSTFQSLLSSSSPLLTNLAQHTSRLQQDSTQIQSKLQHSINIQSRALANENQELSSQLATVQHLTTQRDNLLTSNTSCTTKLQEAHSQIQSHTQQRNQYMEDITNIESKFCTRDLPKIKQELTLHAALTNLKWDYSAPKYLLRGEVSLVERGVLREFEVERCGEEEGGGVVVVADRLWDIVEGGD